LLLPKLLNTLAANTVETGQSDECVNVLSRALQKLRCLATCSKFLPADRTIMPCQFSRFRKYHQPLSRRKVSTWFRPSRWRAVAPTWINAFLRRRLNSISRDLRRGSLTHKMRNLTGIYLCALRAPVSNTRWQCDVSASIETPMQILKLLRV